jgi:DNA-binding YbaB/EbfC family protein
MSDIMKNIQQLQSRMGEAQEQLGKIQVTGSAGGDMVVVMINGLFEVLSVRIDPVMADPKDVRVLEELVQSAMTDALVKVREKIQEEMSQTLGGLPPGMFPGVL